MNFEGKTVVITGAAQGIGRATAVAFAEAGADLVLVDRDPAGLEQSVALAATGTGSAEAIEADVSCAEGVRAYVDLTRKRFGRLDCLFNNAGIDIPVRPIQDVPEEEFDRIVAVNLRSVFLGMKYVLPIMIEQGSGSIVNTSSVSGLAPNPRTASYGATKHAIIGLTKSVATEVARQGVRVNAVCPGPVATSMLDSIIASAGGGDEVTDRIVKTTPMARIAEAREIAAVVLFLASDAAGYVTGVAVPVDGGTLASPGSL